MGTNRISMNHTFVISLTDFAGGAELLELQLSHVTAEQMGVILEEIQHMIRDFKEYIHPYHTTVQNTINKINEEMGKFIDNTVVCSLCPGLTPQQVHDIVHPLDEESMEAEISIHIPSERVIISDTMRPFVHVVNNHRIFAIELEFALQINWTVVLESLAIPEYIA